jgi:hypothetical protein
VQIYFILLFIHHTSIIGTKGKIQMTVSHITATTTAKTTTQQQQQQQKQQQQQQQQ